MSKQPRIGDHGRRILAQLRDRDMHYSLIEVRAGFGFGGTDQYMGTLRRHGFVERIDRGRWRITPKGRAYMQQRTVDQHIALEHTRR